MGHRELLDGSHAIASEIMLNEALKYFGKSQTIFDKLAEKNEYCQCGTICPKCSKKIDLRPKYSISIDTLDKRR